MPLNCSSRDPNTDVANANDVPRLLEPLLSSASVSPPESWITPRIIRSTRSELLTPGNAGRLGDIRNTGRSAGSLRNAHFQSSLTSPPPAGSVDTSSMLEKKFASCTASRLSIPALTGTFCRLAGTNVEAHTRIVYVSGLRESKRNRPFTLVCVRAITRSFRVSSSTTAPGCGIPDGLRTHPSIAPSKRIPPPCTLAAPPKTTPIKTMPAMRIIPVSSAAIVADGRGPIPSSPYKAVIENSADWVKL